jgi:hypothetical protein
MTAKALGVIASHAEHQAALNRIMLLMQINRELTQHEVEEFELLVGNIIEYEYLEYPIPA